MGIQGHYKLLVNNVSQASWCGVEYPNSTVRWNTWKTIEQCTSGNKKACLFNIYDDPEEHQDLAHQLPDLVDQILAKMETAQASVYDPPRGKVETREACATVQRNGGFWGLAQRRRLPCQFCRLLG